MIIRVFFPLANIEFLQFHYFKDKKMNKVTNKPC